MVFCFGRFRSLNCLKALTKNAPNLFGAFFVFMGKFGAYEVFFGAWRTGVPSSLQMPKPVAAQSREKMGTNQLSRA